MKRSTLLALLATAAVGAVALTSPGSAQTPDGRTLTLIEHDESQAFGDVFPIAKNKRNPRFSGGDMHVFTSRYFNTENKPVGKLYAYCITVRAGRTFIQASFQCNATIALRDGTLAATVAFRGNQRDEDVLTAITGGTGAYHGARGSLAQRNLPNERMQNTIHLLP